MLDEITFFRRSPMQHNGTTANGGVNIDAIIGRFHTFGDDGVAYEVLEFEEGEETALIRVLETGETLRYPVAHIQQDPAAQ